MSVSVVLFAWTCPGAQAKHVEAAAQLGFVKELAVLFIGAEDDNYLNSYSESTV